MMLVVILFTHLFRALPYLLMSFLVLVTAEVTLVPSRFHVIMGECSSTCESIRFWLISYAVLDCAFYFTYFLPRLRLAQLHREPPPLDLERITSIWKRILQHDCQQQIENSADTSNRPLEFLDKWFEPTPLGSISRGALVRWLIWALFDRSPDQLVQEPLRQLCLDTINEIIDKIEERRQIRFAVYEKPNLRLIRLNLDPVRALARPLFYYAVTSSFDCVSDILLWCIYGFVRKRIGDVSMWIRHPKPSGQHAMHTKDAQRPLVFVHGVGIGLVIYQPLLAMMMNKLPKSICVVLLEVPHVSMKLGLDCIPNMNQVALSMKIAFEQHQWRSALWIGHSLGTFIISAVHRLQPKLVDSIMLIDPVCFNMWEADVVRNFCYNQNRTGREMIRDYHVSRELHIHSYFHRHFYWHHCVMFAEDLPARSTVFVSLDDDLYCAARVAEQLKARGVKTIAWPGTSHGGWLFKWNELNVVSDEIEHMASDNGE